MGIEAGTLAAWAAVASAAASAGTAAYSIKKGEKEKGMASKHRKELERKAQKEKELGKRKSPSQRLLGGRPTLG